MIDGRLLEIAVVGDGVAGWTATAAIARRLKGARVALVPPVDPAPSLLDRILVAAPSARDFHEDMRLDETHFVDRTGAGYRLGSLLQGWTGRGRDIFHGYGDHGAAWQGVPFHQVWLRAPAPAPFDLFSVAARAALGGRFAHPARDAPPLAHYAYGFHADPGRYASLMRDLAAMAGAALTPACTEVVRDRDRVGLRLTTGVVLNPHLVVDATADGRIIARLDGARDDWSPWLPCDRLIFADEPDASPSAPHDTLAAWSSGWQLSAPRPGACTHALAWSSAHAGPGRAERALRNATRLDPTTPALPLSPGRVGRAWVGNVVAVGEAAVVAGPVEGMALHLLHAHCDRMLALLPDRGFAPVELAEYNRQVAQEADRIRDFLHLRHQLAARSEPFWREGSRVAPPSALAYDLALFGERGRLTAHDEETFDRESWLAMLIGFGLRPHRTDALAAAIEPAAAEKLLARLDRDVAVASAALPLHSDYLKRLCRSETPR